jgi:hypothetical protein
VPLHRFLHQQGGGWCYDLPGCVGRSTGSLGSTKADKNTSSLNSGYTSLDPKVNPLMYNWNSVEIRYCDGASVSGDKPTPTVVNGTTLHFRGRAILDAEIKSLLEDRGMDKATDVVVSGCSAGGLATFLHCDHWAAAIATATDSAAKVTTRLLAVRTPVVRTPPPPPPPPSTVPVSAPSITR